MKVMIYAKENCMYCKMAKELCERESIPYEYKMLGVDYNKQQLHEMAPGYETYPQIFVNREGFWENVGGHQELEKMV